MIKEKKKYVTLSFDDGTVQDVRFIGLLNKYGVKSTFNLNSGLFGTKHRIIHDGIDCDHTEITADMVRELYAGHEVAVHTVSHPNLAKLDSDGVFREVEGDRLALEALCGYPIIGMAYPGGPFYTEETISTILTRTPIRYARNVRSSYTFAPPARYMEWSPTCKLEDEALFDLCERFKAAEADEAVLLFYVWGHSFELDKYKSWDRFERFLDTIAGMEDTAYVTNGEFYASHPLPAV